MQRMQSVDLGFLILMIAAFLLGCVSLSIGAARANLVPKWNPLLCCLALSVALLGGLIEISGRMIGLTCLGLLSASVAGIGVALWKALR
jgi:hypothetical protein